MLTSLMACSRITLMQRRLTRQNHLELIRKLFMLNIGSRFWKSAKANLSQKPKLVACDLSKSHMKTYSSRVKIPSVGYNEIKNLPKHPEKLLIDVRDPVEIERTGLIPTAIHIPLGMIARELGPNVSPSKFEERYARQKPDKTTVIIMQCLTGKRSDDAAQIAKSLGYKNVYKYTGSWIDWVEREGLEAE